MTSRLERWVRWQVRRAGQQVGRVQARLASLRQPETPDVLLTAFDGRSFTGVVNEVGEVPPVHFEVFAAGQMVSSTRTTGLRLAQAGPQAWTFSFDLPAGVAKDAPSVSVKHEGSDRFVRISPDLTGFVNNVNETAVPSGHLLENPLFFLTVSANRFWPEVDEALVRHVTGGATLQTYYLVGYAVVLDILSFGVIAGPGAKVVELGCGCGRIAQFVAPMLDEAEGGSYDGYDTWLTGIEWAEAHIGRAYGHVRFHHLGARGGPGYEADRSYRLDLPDGSRDAVLGVSVFTHLRRHAASDYAGEIARILKPGGKAYLTFFASKERFRDLQPLAACEDDEYGIYFVKPEFEDAFVDEAQARRMFEGHGLQVLGVKYGHWRGPKHGYRGYAGYQDLFIVKKPQG